MLGLNIVSDLYSGFYLLAGVSYGCLTVAIVYSSIVRDE